MESGKKILLTTTYKFDNRPIYDYWLANSPRRLFTGFRMPRIESFGLRFIKQNVPEVEILEYPTWRQYVEKLKEKKWDVVGFSFFLNETHEIIKMAKYAKEQGISETWAGNYGAITPEIKDYFDKIFYGYSENQVAHQFGYSIPNESLIHPPLNGFVSLPFGIKVNSFGYLFTGRGCPYSCEFCQTPAFCRKPIKFPLDSIKKVIDYYKKIGISQVIILDENFGTYRSHSENIIDYLNEKKMFWFADIRADYLAKRIDDWKNKYMAGALTAIESLNQDTLNAINKKTKVNDVINLVKKLISFNKMTVGFFMIGHENETIDSIKRDIKEIAKLKMDITQLCILTPLPLTPLWKNIEEKYGIIDKDWHHYNAKHLVWNHPNITPKEMKEVHNWSLKKLNPRIHTYYTVKRFLALYRETKGFIPGTKYTINHFFFTNAFRYKPKNIRFLEFGNMIDKNIEKNPLIQDDLIPQPTVEE